MKLQLPLTILTLILTVSAVTTDKKPADPNAKDNHDPKDKPKPKPKEKFCKAKGKHNGGAVKCVAKPDLMAQSVATVQSGADYHLPCYVNGGNCLFNHCEWYKLDWEGGECYINGYYTDCDKERHVECKPEKPE